MIQQFRFHVSRENGESVPSYYSYRLYSALLEQMPSEIVDKMHEQGYTGISQYLLYHRDTQNTEWVISLLDDTIIDVLSPVLTSLKTISLHEDTLHFSLQQMSKTLTAQSLISQALQLPDFHQTKLYFPNATAFKSNGKYTIFPSEELILNSLMKRWNTVFPDANLDYNELFPILFRGIQIQDYRLSSCRFRMKNTSIPAFHGEITIHTRLSPPMMEIWKLLCLFSEYTGVGIKTTLGMGGLVWHSILRKSTKNFICRRTNPWL